MFTNKNTDLYFNTAQKLSLPIVVEKDILGFCIKINDSNLYFRNGITPFNISSNSVITDNKLSFNTIMTEANLPVPKMVYCTKDIIKQNNINNIIKTLKFPLIVKPILPKLNHKDILSNIISIEQLTNHIEKCFFKYDSVAIEEYHPGLKSYRVLVFNNKVIGVIQCYPALIFGDGVHTIAELIAMNYPNNNIKKNNSLLLNNIDKEYEIRLSELNLSYDTVLENKRPIPINYTTHPDRGGITKSLGVNISDKNAKLLIRAANALGMNFVSFDIICENILKPITPGKGYILNASSNPEIADHEMPIYGVKNPVTIKIIKKIIETHPISFLLSKYNLFKTNFSSGNSFYIKAVAIISFYLLYRFL